MSKKLQELATNLIKSSRFSGNDPFGFSVPISNTISLPGRFDPAEFLDKLGLKDVSGFDIAVVCPGNGGLVTELLNRGADYIDCYEPRYLKSDGLRASLGLFSVDTDDKKFNIYESWPEASEGELDLKLNYDLIILTNGLEHSYYPIKVVSDIISRLKSSGTLFLEVILGTSDVSDRRYNSWRPSQESLQTMFSRLPDMNFTVLKANRGDNTLVYKIQHQLLVVEDINVNIDKDISVTVVNENQDVAINDEVQKGIDRVNKINYVLSKNIIERKDLMECIDKFGDSFLEDLYVKIQSDDTVVIDDVIKQRLSLKKPRRSRTINKTEGRKSAKKGTSKPRGRPAKKKK